MKHYSAVFNHKLNFIENYFWGDFCAGVVPDGTYEVCSRTTGQAAAGKFMTNITFFTYMN